MSGIGSDLLPVLGGAGGLVWSGGSATMALVGAALGAVARPLIGRWFALKEQAAAREQQRYDETAGSGAGALTRASAVVAAALNEIHQLDNDAAAAAAGLKSSRLALAARLGGGAAVPVQIRDTYRRNERATELLEEAQQILHRATTGLSRFFPRLL